MVECGEDFSLTLKSRETIWIIRNRRRQHLDRNLTLELRVSCPIHLTHPTHTNLSGDFIRAEARAGVQ